MLIVIPCPSRMLMGFVTYPRPCDPGATSDLRASVPASNGIDGETNKFTSHALAASWETEYALLLMECASYIGMQPSALHGLTIKLVRMVQ